MGPNWGGGPDLMVEGDLSFGISARWSYGEIPHDDIMAGEHESTPLAIFDLEVYTYASASGPPSPR